MNTVTIVLVVVWNFLLFVAFVLVLVFRKRLMHWITGADERRSGEAEDAWITFLADHPELR